MYSASMRLEEVSPKRSTLHAAIILALVSFQAGALFAQQTISYVQGNAAVPQTPQTTVSVPFSAAQTAGDLNVVVVGWNDSTATVTALTDTRGNTYKLAVGPTILSGVASQSIYYAGNIVPAAAGANVVTVTFSNPAIYPDIRILEYRGADLNNPVDVTAASSGNSATSSSGSATITNATDLIFGANLVQTATTGPGTGFATRLLTSPDGDIAEDQMVMAVGSYSATASLFWGQWIMQMVAFRAAAAVSAPPVITSATSATGTVGTAFSYQITATNSPTSYGATGFARRFIRQHRHGINFWNPDDRGKRVGQLERDQQQGDGHRDAHINHKLDAADNYVRARELRRTAIAAKHRECHVFGCADGGRPQRRRRRMA